MRYQEDSLSSFEALYISYMILRLNRLLGRGKEVKRRKKSDNNSKVDIFLPKNPHFKTLLMLITHNYLILQVVKS